MIEFLGIGLAFALAMNMGANNAGVHMAPAFGAGVRGKRSSLILFAIFTALGAGFLGWPVSETVGKGIFFADRVDLETLTWPLVVLAPAITVGLLGTANYLKVPVPTTPIAVCSLIGVGLFFGIVNGVEVGTILIWWVATPIGALILTWMVGKLLLAKFPGRLHNEGLSPRARKWIGWLLTAEGCYSAFAIGANNVGNAIGPIFGAGLMGIVWASVLGATGFVVGTFLWGGRVLETVGKGITELCYVRALAVGMISSTGVLVASIFGAPVSGALIVTSGLIGFSLAVSGAKITAKNHNVRKIALVWATGPALAIGVSYALTWIMG